MSLGVPEDALLDEVDGVVVVGAVEEGVGSEHLDVAVLGEHALDLHLFGGHGSGLSAEDLGDFSHLLWGGEVSDEDLVLLEHVDDGVGKGDGDSHWKSLWDGHDDDDKGNGQVLDESLEELLASVVVVRESGSNEEHDHGDGEDDTGSDQTKEGEGLGEAEELLLERGLGVGVECWGLNTSGAVASDAGDDGLARSGLNVALGVEEGVVLALFRDSLLTGLLEDCNVVLVAHKVGRLDNEAVCWDLVSGRELDDVADDEVPDVETLHGSDLSTEGWEGLIAGKTRESGKGSVHFPVVEGGNRDKDEEGCKNGDTLNPSGFEIVDHTSEDREHGKECNQHTDPVVECGLLDGVPEGWVRDDWLLVDTEAIGIQES